MIRVLQIIGSLERAGAETFLVNLYKNIDRSLIQFDFAIYEEPTDNSYYDEVLKLGAEVFILPNKSNGIIKNFREIKRIVKENHYYIVWRHTGSCFGGIDLLAAACGGAKRTILHSHSSKAVGIEKYLHFLFKPIVNVCITDRFACGKKAGKWMFYGKKFEVINNGIDTIRFCYNKDIRKTLRKKYKLEDKFVIGHIGRFHSEKNHPFLVEIFEKLQKRVPDAMLMLIGTGGTEDEIKKQVIQKSIESNVMFMGNRSDISELLQVIDVFVMPSFYEGLPVTLIEAQDAGLPCVVSNTISREVDITETIEFLSLKESTEKWVSSIIRQGEKRNIDNHIKIKNNGYDINDVATKIEKRIMEMVR